MCLEDGKRFKSLKRHLRTQYNMTPEQYRDKWGLPADYPMVAPNYAVARSQLAKKMGMEPAMLVHAKAMGSGFTFFVVYGAVSHVVDLRQVKATIEQAAVPAQRGRQRRGAVRVRRIGLQPAEKSRKGVLGRGARGLLVDTQHRGQLVHRDLLEDLVVVRHLGWSPPTRGRIVAPTPHQPYLPPPRAPHHGGAEPGGLASPRKARQARCMSTAAEDRTLILVRHSKAEQVFGKPDHDRELTDRGHRDAKALGEWLHGHGLICDVVVCSTGLIGERLPLQQLLPGVDVAAAALSADGLPAAARAIMTTDSVPKLAAADGTGWSVAGIAKGAGMLAPALATMLVVLTTDALVDAQQLDLALRRATALTFDRLDVDGATSTNDTVLLLSSGASQIRVEQDDLDAAVFAACDDLAALGDDVVSIDNNYIQKTANYGQFCYPDGRMGSAADFIGGDPWLTNPREVAFALSVGAVSTKVNELFPGSMTPLPFFSQPEEE